MGNKIHEKLASLPQIQRIRRADAQRWLQEVGKQHPSKILWILDRMASGFGGSEIGALLLDAQGKPAPFLSACDIVNEKLMRALPHAPNKYMRKGIILEEAVRLATLRLYGGTFDSDAVQAFNTPHPKDPYGICGNPDFPWILQDGSRALVDIKVPGSGEEMLDDKDKQFLYLCQLNTYNILNDTRQLPKFNQLLNIHLELPTIITDAMSAKLHKEGQRALPAVVEEMVTLLKYDTPGMRLHLVDQPINPTIDFNNKQRPLNELIKEVAAVNWQCVLDGDVPSLSESPSQSLSEKQKLSIEKLEKQLFTLEGISKATQGKISEIKLAIEETCKTVNKEGLLSQTGRINIKQSRYINTEAAKIFCNRHSIPLPSVTADKKAFEEKDYKTLAMAEKLQALGEDLAPFIHEQPIDPGKFVTAMEDVGASPSRAFSWNTKVSTNRKKITQSELNELISSCRPLIDGLVADIATDNEQRMASTSSTNVIHISR